ncbi:TPA: hypothetical protein PTV74_003159 [Clostridium botulinum]|nr:hypothetical protein [Clostridium botulinum]HDK7206314.1 hypothetical protein [Clostridium botulinum]HDK7210050.1 hypothetical protein [Clostridium botulinum]HDK7265499.1 hypothetical protein [Clostridium botulinum]HDK7269347.1 hypothetical protein [Clostridium botulinum]
MNSKNNNKQNMNITIAEYQSWTINNTRNRLGSISRKGESVLVFVSDKDINELELFGLESLVKKSANIWTGLDLNIFICKAGYNQKGDFLYPQLDIEQKYYENLFPPKILKASDRLYKGDENLLVDNKEIIYIYSVGEPRWDKSNWWRVTHPRKCNVINNIGYF